ncbi:MAG: acylphosphatase [Coriobacteriia bacterium]
MDQAVSRARVIVSGLVQGVYFRASTVDAARRLGLAGWVRNLPGGSVEAVFEGPVGSVEAAIEWTRTGPRGARVSSVEVTRETPLGETGFSVRR